MVTKNYFSTHLGSGVIAMVAMMLLSLIPASVYAAVTAPTDVKVTTLTPTSATLGWEWTTTESLDRHDIDIRVSTVALTSSVYPTATTETEGVVLSQTVENLEEPSFLIAPLAEGTYYYVYMRENATHDNQGTSSWVILTFATPCSATSQLPISENFDASATQLPTCWSSLGTAPAFSSSIHHGDAGNSVKLDGSVASSYLYSPILSSSSNAYYLTAYIYGAAGATYRVGIASTEDWLNAEILLEGTIKTANTWTFIDAVVPAELRAAIEGGMEFLWVIYSAEGDNSSFYVDDVEIGLLPACITPSALTIGEVTENSVQLSWTERGTATSWVVEYSDGTETYQVTANSNPFILGSLTSNTAYTVRVQANCGSESSNQTEVENFKTLCGVTDIPFSESFEDVSAIPDCWSQTQTVAGSGSGTDYADNCWKLNTYSYNAHSGSKSLQLQDTKDGTHTILVSPHFATEVEGGLTLSFWMYRTTGTTKADEGVKVWVNNQPNLNGATALMHVTRCGGVPADALKVAPITTSGWYQYEKVLPIAGDVYVIFEGISEYGSSSYLDDIEVSATPTCLKPTDLHLASFDAESATLAWTAGGSESAWELTYKLGTNDAVTVPVNGTPEYIIEGLTPATSYTLSNLSLCAVCSTTDSSAVASFSNISFKTPCMAVTTYETDFEDETSSSGNMPECWTKVYSTSTSYPYVYDYSSYANSGTKCLYVYGSAPSSYSYGSPFSGVVALPQINGNVSDYRLIFMARESSSYASQLAIGVLDDIADTTSFTVVDTITLTSSYASYTVNFASYTGTGKYVAIKYIGVQTSVYLDDVVLEPVPTCEKPGAISAVASYDYVTLQWTAGGDETKWQLAYQLGEEAAQTVIVENEPEYTISALEASTNYTISNISVKAICAVGDTSYARVLNTLNILTKCGPQALPLSESFDYIASGVPACWDNSETTVTDAAYNWNYYSTNSCLRFNSYSASKGQYGVLKSPIFTVPTDRAVELTFRYMNPTGGDFSVYVSRDGGVTMEEEALLSGLTGQSDWKEMSVSFDAAATDKLVICFKAISNWGSGDAYIYLDDVSIKAPLCSKPYGAKVVAVTDNSVDLGWADSYAASYKALLFASEPTTVSEEAALSVKTVESTAASFDGLEANTQYYVYIQGICDAENSEYSKVFAFRTACAAEELPYVEDFEDAGSILCWKAIGEAATVQSTTVAFGGSSKALALTSDSVNVMLVSPKFNVESLASYNVNLAAYSNAPDTLAIGVIVDINHPADTYIDLGIIGLATAKQWNEYSFSFAALSEEGYEDYANAQYIAISVPANSSVIIDAVEVVLPAQCAKPTAITIETIGENVSIDWTSEAASHEAIITSADTVAFSGVVSKPFIPEGLVPNSDYQIKVRAICPVEGEDDPIYSDWSAEVAFKTPCSAVALPFSENFDDYTSAPALGYTVSTHMAPDCWSFVADGGNYSMMKKSENNYASSGTVAMIFSNTNEVFTLLPTINADNRKTMLTLKYRMESASSSGTFVIGYLTNARDTASFVAVQKLTKTTVFTDAEVIFPAMEYLYPAIKFIPNSSSWYAAFDDVVIDYAPSCVKPSGLTLGEVSATSAKLSWTANGDENQWQLIYKLSSKSVADTLTVEGTPEYVIPNLTAATSYTLSDISLRAICSETDSSEIVSFSNLSFMTECEVQSMPFEEDFTATTLNSCWNKYSVLFTDGVSTANVTATGSWNRGTTVFANGEMKLNVYGTSCSSWLVTPSIAINGEDAYLSFDLALTDYGNTDVSESIGDQADDKFMVIISTNGTTWNLANATVWSNEAGAANSYDAIPNTGTKVTIPLGAYNGQTIRIAFYGESTTSNGDNDLHISNIEVAVPATCDRPTALAASDVTVSSATISITGGEAWEYVLNSTENEPIAVSENPFTISGLEAQTTYTVYVRNICSADNKSEWRSLSFATACGLSALPFSEGFEDLTSGNIPECWDNSQYTCSASYRWQYNSSYHDGHSGSDNAIIFNAYSASDGTTSTLLTPHINNGEVTDLKLSFYMKNGGAATLDVKISLDGGTTYPLVFLNAEVGSSSWEKYNYSFEAPANSDIVVSFTATSDWGSYRMYLDEVVLEEAPACEAPTALNLVAATDASLQIAIVDDADATAWEYALNSVDGEIHALDNSTFMIEELDAQTEYTVYVRRVCSETVTSAWMSATFKTLCPAVELPFTEDFSTLNSIPECWTNEHLAGTSTTVWSISSGRAYISYQSYGNEALLATPKVALQAGVAYRISFDTQHTLSSTYDDETHIYLANSALGDSIHQFCNIFYGGRVASGEVSHLYTFTPETDMEVCLVVKRIFDNDYGFYLDNIVIEEVPACEKPQGLSVVEISASQVTVQIADTASTHTAWQVIAVPQGNTFNEEDAQDAPAKLATYAFASLLNSGDIVDVYVRAACGDEDGNSPWFGPVQAKYVDYSSIAPAGVAISTEGDYPWTLVQDGAIAKLQSTNAGVSSSVSDIVATVTVQEGMNGTFSFDYYASGEGSSTLYDYLCVYVDEANPTTSNYLSGFGTSGKAGTPSSMSGTYSISLTEGVHTIRWRFYKDSSTDDGDDMAQVWNFTLSEQAFFTPSDLHVTALSGERVTLAWSPCGDATGYQINLKTNGLDSVLTTTENSLTIEGLSAQTVYTAAIRSCNLTDTTAYSAIVRFTTPCASVDLPFSENFDDISSIPACWTNAHIAGSSTTVWSISSNAAYINYQSSGNQVLLATPMFNMQAGVKYRIMFDTEHTLSSSYSDETHIYLANSALGDSIRQMCNIKYNGLIPSGAYSHKYVFTPEEDMELCLVFKRIFTNDYSFYLDNIVIEEVPACDMPDGVSVVSAEGSTIQLAITDADVDHNAWDAVVVAKDATLDETLAVTGEDKIFNVTLETALVNGASYDIYVRTNCGEDGNSAWIGPLTYKFVDYSAVVAGGSLTSDGDYPWDMIEDGGITKLQSTNSDVNSSYSDLKGTFVVGEGEKGTLSFEYYVQSESAASGTPIYDNLVIYVDAVPNATNSSGYDAVFGKVGGTTGMSGRYVLSLAEGTHTIVWRYYKDSSTASGLDAAQVWNINFISTSKWAPTDLTLVEVSTDTAAITWTQCDGVVSNEVKIGETVYISETNAIVLRDLTPNTEYKAVVRSILAEEEATPWSDTLIFRTECSSINLPYKTSFEEADGGLACWTVYQTQVGSGSGNNYGDEGWIVYTTTTSSSYSIHTGNASAQLRDAKNGTHTILASPEFNASEDSIRISFWMYRDAGASKQNEGVKLYVNSKDSIADATALMHVTRCGGVAATGIKVEPVTSSGWYEYHVTVKPEGNFYVLFEGISEYGSSSYIDDIRVSKLAYAEPYTDITCSTQDYEGYGFTLAQEDMHAGLNRLVRIEESENETAVDTARVLELTVVESSITELNDTACAGSGYYKNGFNINNVRSNIRYELYLTNVAGCDSIVYLTLYVPETNYMAAATICEGDTYQFGTQTLSTSGEYQETFTSVECGCDSIVTLTLTVLPAQVTLNETICEGDSIFFNGAYRKESDAYVAELTNILGCDSTVTLNLTVLEKTNEARQGVFCSGSVYNDNDFVDLDSAGVYTLVLTNAANCDSIITLTLVEHEPEAVSVSATIVQGEAYVFGNNTYTEEGVYVETFVDQYGCDSVVTLTLTVSTDLEEVLSNEEIKAAEKFMHNGILYIRANDIIYDAQGKRVIVRKED